MLTFKIQKSEPLGTIKICTTGRYIIKNVRQRKINNSKLSANAVGMLILSLRNESILNILTQQL